MKSSKFPNNSADNLLLIIHFAKKAEVQEVK